MFSKFTKVFWIFIVTALPFVSFAHEVYVLDDTEISHALLSTPLNLLSIAVENEHQFLLIAFLAILGVICILGVSLSRGLEKLLDPFFFKIKKYAGHIAQITLGSAVIASSYYNSLFGTELPFEHIFGSYAFFVKVVLCISGVSLLLGLYPRAGAFMTMAVYILWSLFCGEGSYVLSYMTYLGEALIITVLGGGYQLIDLKSKSAFRHSHLFKFWDRRKYFIIRIFFSISLIYAAFYAKWIHGQLALQTVLKYNLTNYFHFSPEFVVLGAFIVEIIIGLFFLIGFELRFTSLFFLTFLTMSLFFFGEVVWPHLILIGTAISIFVHGYDEYTIERRWYKSGRREPVL